MTSRVYRYSDRAPVSLDSQLGRGGEGIVYSIKGELGFVAKLYHELPSAAKADKLKAMVRSATPELLALCAWPTEVLENDEHEICGFLMPRVSAREDIHELYTPKSRAIAFPEADFHFLVQVAMNLARAFTVVHVSGHILGDVNHGSVLVGSDGSVMLIDCDSFQVSEPGVTYTCDVGVPLFTPPELHGQPFRGLQRSMNHDAFGLGVLLFHLLFMGRHPFAGRYQGGEMSIERAIREFRFVYGADSVSAGMQAPPGTLPLDAFGPQIAKLFTMTFGRAEAIDGRPQAVQWLEALRDLREELVMCEVSPAHHRPKGRTCCWCELETRTGTRLFGHRSPRNVNAEFESIWSSIEAIPEPGQESPISREILDAFSDLPEEGASYAHRKLAALIKQWNETCSSDPFDALLSELSLLRDEFLRLREALQKGTYVATEQEQLERYLDLFRIDRASIPEVGPPQRAMLASYGIETAADIAREQRTLEQIVDATAAERLLHWLDARRADFRYEQSPPQDPQEVAAFRDRIARRQEQLIDALKRGAEHLARLRDDILLARARLRPALKAAIASKPRDYGRSEKGRGFSGRRTSSSGGTSRGGCSAAIVFGVLAIVCFSIASGIYEWASSARTELGFGGLIFLIALGLAGLFGVIFIVCAFGAARECMHNRQR